MKQFTNSSKTIASIVRWLFTTVIIIGITAFSFAQTVTTITTSGTFTIPAGVTTVTAYLWGGGGGGGGSATSGANWSNGGGGGGGACAFATFGVTAGNIYTVTIGAGGTAGTGTGGTGGTTTFTGAAGTWTAGGGTGGTLAGTGSNGTFAGGAGSAVGTGTGVAVKAGAAGSSGKNVSGITGTGGGAGGSSAGGTVHAVSCGALGNGGTGTYPGGNGGYNTNCSVTTNLAGPVGVVPGGGGSGDNNWSGSSAGGAGGAGEIILVYTVSLGPPTITSFAPTTGCAGTSVVITGTNYSGVTAVQFGGVNAASYVVNSTTQITAVAGASATGAVTVVTGSGTATGGTFTFTTPGAPTAVTATASTICAGQSSNLNATNSGNYINWWTAASGGTLLGTVASATNFSVAPGATTTYYAEAVSASAGTITNIYNYTGAVQTWTVPAGVTSINVDMSGAKGGTGTNNYGVGANGGRTQATYPVSAGQVLNIYVGGLNVGATGGYNGGGNGGGAAYSAGAGGASDIRIGGTALANRVIVAGGGGSGGGDYSLHNYDNGGPGGGLIGSAGYDGLTLGGSYGGGGGTQAAGGAAVGGNGCTAGVTGVGGNGGATYGGSGGGGYFGGGGGGYGGGGGGSNYTDGTATSVINTQGYNAGAGIVSISYSGLIYTCPSATRTSVAVNVLAAPVITAQPANPGPICGGSSATLSVTATGATTYQWYRNGVALTNTAPYSNVATSSLLITTPSVGENGASITCVVGNAAGCTVTTTAVVLNVLSGSGPPVPSPVTATPGTICVGASSLLNAVSSGNNINWWNAASGGTQLAQVASGVNYTVTPGATTTYYAESYTGATGSQTINYTGAIVNWTVPAGVTSINITARGAQGGTSTGTGGLGAIMTGTFAVSSGQVLSILAGQKPAVNGYPGGGGGSFVALGATYSTATPMIVAGGGGGAQTGTGDNASLTTTGDGPVPGTAGNGAASTTCGGGGGGFYTSGGSDVSYPTYGVGGAGFRQGGAGGISASYGPGGFGGGSTADYDASCNIVAGSGGGYSGGSGLNSFAGQDFGYGGGSYNGGTSQANSVGNTGNGLVTITYVSAGCASATRVPVSVTVGTYPVVTVQPVAPAQICGSATVTVSVTATSATAYQWYKNGVALSNVAPYSNVTTNVMTITNPSTGENGSSLTCVVTGTGPCTVTTTAVLLNVGTTPAAPTAVTATASSICAGQTSQLNATSAGNFINWWTAASGGSLLSTVASGANYAVTPGANTTYYAEASTSAGSGSQTFSYTGSIVNFTVPGGVTSINVTAIGATGGITTGFTPLGGNGAKMVGTITVSPGQILKVLVGGAGAAGATNSGGGGGGGTFVTDNSNNPLVIAGGGGGISVNAAGYTSIGADAVTTTGGVSGNSLSGGSPNNYGLGGVGGNGATSYSGGVGACAGNGGGLLTNGQANASCCVSTFGLSFLNGGAGGPVCVATGNGGFGGGGGGGNNGGGGGGGYSGGGGAWNVPTNGGGGGSYNAGTSQSNTAAFNAAGNGSVVITWNLPGCASATRVGASVTVNSSPVITVQPVAPSSVVCSGVTTTSVSVTATGATTYQWQKGGVNISGAPYSGFNSTTLTITNPTTAENGAVLTCVIGNGTGCNVTTNAVTLSVSTTPAAPTPVSATPANICPGATSQLNATSTGNNINWYNAATGGTLLGTVASATNFPVTPGVTTSYYAEAQAFESGTQTFNYTGAIQTFTVPAGVTSLNITAKGASGGYTSGSTAGKGATMTGTFSVTPGQVLSILAGQSPGLTTLYPGGGGGSFVGLGASYTTATPLIVAGGGGAAYNSQTGISAPITTSGTGTSPGTAGNGAPASSCVAGGGGFYTSGGNDLLYAFIGGAGFRQGGAGGAAASAYVASYQAGGFGGGTAGNFVGSCNNYAGSGGGYSGGSGWGTAVGYIGNAGGSYNGGTAQANTSGNNVGNGQVVITWNSPTCVSTTRPSATVSINVPVGSASPQTVCSGVATSVALGSTVVGTTFTWTAAQFSGATVTGFSNCTSGCGTTIAQTLTNTNTTAGVVRYTVTPTSSIGCVGAIFTVDVTVNPAPAVNAGGAVAAICQGGTTAALGGSFSAGATSAVWSASVAGGSFANNGGSTPGTATYTAAANAPSSITLTLTSGGGSCGTVTATKAITVNPKPVLTVSPSSEYLCSPQTTALGLSANVASTYTWTATASSGSVTGFSNCNSSCGSTIAQTITNSGTTTQAVTYIVTATSTLGNCVSATVTAIDSIGGAPVASSSGSTTYCSGSTLAINLSSTIASTDFTWAASLISGTASGFNDCIGGCGSTISDVLINTGTIPAVVRYTVSTSASQSGCQGIDMIINVTINPVPVGSASNITLCSGSSTNISLSSTVANTSYVWTSATLSGTVIGAGTCSSNCGNSIADVLFSMSGVAVVEYTITPTSALGCGGANFTSDVTINQPSVAPNTLNGNNLVCNGSSITITQTGGSLGTGAYWQWYTNPSYGSSFAVGGHLTSADASLSVSPTAVTVYYLRAEGGTAPCAANVTGPSGGLVVHVTTAGAWIGQTSSDWFDATNWCGGVPTSTTNINILNSAPYMPVINTTGAVCKNITIGSGSSVTMNSSSNLTVYGNWVNNGTFTPGSGIVTFGGSITQNVSGASPLVFDNLYTNNSSSVGVNINNDVTVRALLEMDNGNIHTGSNTITADSNATAIGNGGFVIGNLRAYITPDSSGSASITYPIGTGTSYAPVDLFIDSVSHSGYITASTTAGDHPNIATSAFNAATTVNRYWTMTNSGVVLNQFSLGLQYQPSDIDAGVIEADIEAQNYTGSAWGAMINGVNSGGYEFINGLTSFGDYQIGQIIPVPSLYSISPVQGAQTQTMDVTFNGAGYISGTSSVNVGAGITVNTTTFSGDTLITANITIASGATLGARPFSVTNTGPGGGTSDSVTFTVVAPLPVANFQSNTVTIPCNVSGTVQFDNYSTNATSYSWNFGAGATPATATGFGPYTVSYSTVGVKTITLTATNSFGTNTQTRTNYITVSGAAASVPSYISGPVGLCNLIGVNVTYSCPVVNGAVSYDWTLPTNCTLVSGQTTTTIVVMFNSSFTSGNIAVHSTNGCGSSADRTISVAAPSPIILGSISGPDVVCGVNSAIYSVTPVAGATSYNWTVPTGVTGMTITGGQGTNTLNVTCSAGTIVGYITVQATGPCGTTAIDSMKVTKKPEVHGNILGATSVCGLTSTSYHVAPVFGATSYAWTLPSGMTIATGANTDSIGVTITSAFVTGVVQVSAVNACGNIPGVTLTVIGNVPAAPISLSGPANVCGLSTATYTCPAATGASTYVWTVPSGLTITSGQNTTSLTVGVSGFTTGSISVVAHNTCGDSPARTLALSVATPTPGAITGPALTCGNTSTNYSIAAVAGASPTGYVWTVPIGVTINSGQGTTNIAVTFGSSYSAGNVTVTATNGCTTSAARSLPISKLAGVPVSISGPANVCGTTSATYTIAAVTGASSYAWVVPSTFTIVSGQGTTALNVTFAGIHTAAGSLKVASVNSCGTSAYRTLAIAVCADPISMNNTADAGNTYSAIYPNPTTNEFTIDVTSDVDKDVIVEVYDILGNLMIQQKHQVVSGVNTMKTNIESYKDGMYFVRLLDKDSNVLYTQRVVKQ